MTVRYAKPLPGAQPPLLHPAYRSTLKRAPLRPPLRLEQGLSEITGPGFTSGWAGPSETDLTRAATGEAMGQRIVVTGRLRDGDGRPIRQGLVELWQCNAAGRYLHEKDARAGYAAPAWEGPPFRATAPGSSRCAGASSIVKASHARACLGRGQRLAARAHPLLPLRARLRDAADHPDVLPG